MDYTVKEDPKATHEVKSWCLTVTETHRHANDRAYEEHLHPHSTPSRSHAYRSSHTGTSLAAYLTPGSLPTQSEDHSRLQLGELSPRESGPLQNGDFFFK